MSYSFKYFLGALGMTLSRITRNGRDETEKFRNVRNEQRIPLLPLLVSLFPLPPLPFPPLLHRPHHRIDCHQRPPGLHAALHASAPATLIEVRHYTCTSCL